MPCIVSECGTVKSIKAWIINHGILVAPMKYSNHTWVIFIVSEHYCNHIA